MRRGEEQMMRRGGANDEEEHHTRLMRRRGAYEEEERSRTVVELSVQPRAPAPLSPTTPTAHKNSAFSSRYVKPSPSSSFQN